MYRLLALAEMLRNDFECVFVSNNPDPFILSEIEKICSDCIVINGPVYDKHPDELISGEEMLYDMSGILSGTEIVVIDGYLFGNKYQKAVLESGAQLVYIDDFAKAGIFADAIINHAPGIKEEAYSAPAGAKICTGLDYAILRTPFFNSIVPSKKFLNRAFVSLGGTDSFNFTGRLVELIIESNQFKEIHVLCSSSFSPESIERLERKALQMKMIRLHFNLGANQLVDLLDSCSDAFVSSSTVLIEAYARGLRCFAGYYINNQKLIYSGFVSRRMASGLGHFDHLSLAALSEGLNHKESLNVLDHSLQSINNIKALFNSL